MSNAANVIDAPTAQFGTFGHAPFPLEDTPGRVAPVPRTAKADCRVIFGKVRTIELVFVRVNDIHCRVLGLRRRMCFHIPGLKFRVGCRLEGSGSDVDGRTRHASRLGQRGARSRSDLHGLTQLVPRNRQLGVGTRLISSRPELMQHQRSHARVEHFEAVDVRARSSDTFVRRKHRQERIRGGSGDLQLGERGLAECEDALGTRDLDVRSSLAEVDRFPGQ